MFEYKNRDHSQTKHGTKRSRSGIALILIYTAVLAFLLAVPRLTAGAKFSSFTLMHCTICGYHVLYPVVIGAMIWELFQRRRRVGIIILTVLLIFWGPLALYTLEFAITDNDFLTQNLVFNPVYGPFYKFLMSLPVFEFIREPTPLIL